MRQLLKRYWYIWCLILVVVFLLYMRHSHVNQIPYIAEPFDVAAFTEEIRKKIQEGNAYEDYAQGSRLVNKWLFEEGQAMWIATWSGDDYESEGDRAIYDFRLAENQEDLLKILDANQGAMMHWLQGVEKKWKQAGQFSLNLFFRANGESAVVPDEWEEATPSLLELIALLKAAHLRNEGQLEESWEYCLSALKFRFQPSRAVGLMDFENSNLSETRREVHAMESLLADPRLSDEMLLKIAQDLSALPVEHHKLSDRVKLCYFISRGAFQEDHGRTVNRMGFWDRDSLILRGDKLFGNAELYHRFNRLLCQNALRFCDLPESEHPELVTVNRLVQCYQSEGSSDGLSVSSQELVSMVALSESNLVRTMSVFALERALADQKVHDIYREGYQLLAALHRYHRAQGKFPETLADLVPDYIDELPTDHFADKKPLRYRLENGNALFWSIGPDEADDEAAVSVNYLDVNVKSSTGDLVFHAWKPGMDPQVIWQAYQSEKQ